MNSQRRWNEGAEHFMNNKIDVLDKGYVKLVDYMGADLSICEAARVSYNRVELKEPDDGSRLINYLMKHRHTSPFEHAIMTFEVKLPIFVAREWIRHRTARVNEMSARYTELPEEFYVPTMDRIKGQDKQNKQGSAGELPENVKGWFLGYSAQDREHAYQSYKHAIETGVSREIARIGLPISIYTKWIWQCDLHNLLHFLKLRMAPNAQWEIQQYANAISKVVQASFPITWAAFDEHVLGAVTLSKSEAKKVLDTSNNDMSKSLTGGSDGHSNNGEGHQERNQKAEQSSNSVEQRSRGINGRCTAEWQEAQNGVKGSTSKNGEGSTGTLG